MFNRIKENQFLHTWWPYILIVLAWLIFASPYIFKGNVPFPSTYLVDFFPPWNTFYGLPVKNNAMPDVITQIYPWKMLTIESWKLGQIPAWNPYQFAGTPLLANVQSAVFTPINILFLILPFLDAWSIAILLQPLLAGLFMLMYLKQIGLRGLAGVVSSIAFMFCGFMTVWMAYGTLGYAILVLPLLLYAIEKIYSKQTVTSGILISAGIAWTLFSGHFQTSLYTLLLAGIYSFARAVSKKQWKTLLYLLGYACLGLAIAAPQLIPAIRFHGQSVRSGMFQAGEVIPWHYLPTILAPDVLGNPVTRNDWFGHYAEWASYFGVVPFILALLSIVLGGAFRFFRRFFVLTAVVSLCIAFPTLLGKMLVSAQIPVLSTSSLSRVIVLFSFSGCVLAGLGADMWARGIAKKAKLNLWAVLAVVGAVFLFLWAMILSGNLFFIDVITPDKLPIAKRNMILPTLLYAGSVMVLMIGIGRGKVLRFLGQTALVCLVAFDLLRFAGKWMPFDSRQYVYPAIGSLRYLQTYAGVRRVFGNFGNEAQGAFRLHGVEGYDPLYIRRYGEFISYASNGTVTPLSRSVVLLGKQGTYAKQALDLLGVRYLLHSKGDARNEWAFPFWLFPESFGSPVYSDEHYEIYENTRSYPRAFVVSDYIVASDPTEILQTMFDLRTDLSRTVVLEEDPGIPKTKYVADQAVIEAPIQKYSPNTVTLTVEVDTPSILFLSDTYFPGWTARVNGIETPILRANYAFRAVVVPKGVSEVQFLYEHWFL